MGPALTGGLARRFYILSSTFAARTATPRPILDRVLAEGRERWDARLVVLSGGPPSSTRRRDDVLDLVARHRRFLYLLFTNGTLITLDVAQRLGKLGNLTPAISVEGVKRSRTVGGEREVPRHPASNDVSPSTRGSVRDLPHRDLGQRGEVLSDPFLDLFFEEEGAFYGILLRYLPIGRRPDLNRMLTPHSRSSCGGDRGTLWRIKGSSTSGTPVP